MFQVEEIRDVYPGDKILEKGFKDYGIYNNKATVVGKLCKIDDLFFIKSKTKNYTPRKYDIVIGKVIFVSQDYYKVDLNYCIGVLPALSFINASKKNKPELEKDDYVACQVVRVECVDPLLCCKKEGLGKINEAFAIDSWKIRLFYFNDFIKCLSKDKNFKIILAINGYIWLEGDCEVKKEVLNQIRQYI